MTIKFILMNSGWTNTNSIDIDTDQLTKKQHISLLKVLLNCAINLDSSKFK